MQNKYDNKMITDAAKLILERERTHGSYELTAMVAEAIKSSFRLSPNWNSLPSQQKMSLDLIAVKIARILCGAPNFKDHWDDIEGYAKLGYIKQKKD